MTILLPIGLAVLAAWFAVPAPATRDLQRRLAAAAVDEPRARWRGWGTVVWVLLTAATVGAAYVLLGPRAAVLALAGWLATGTVVRLLRHRARARASLRARAEVARACGLLAAHLRVGQVPAVALGLAAADCPVLAESRRAFEVGGDVTRIWRVQARREGRAGLVELARAWQVSVDTGAPMSATLEQVAASLTADQNLRSVVSSELAAPRATGKVMAALPLCGIGLGYLLGGDPVHWLLAAPPGWGCLLGGVALACLGVLWIERLAQRAATQE